MKHPLTKQYLHKRYLMSKRRLVERLKSLNMFMDTYEIPNETMKYLHRRINEIIRCRRRMYHNKPMTCESVCLCGFCQYRKILNYAKQLREFFEKNNTPLYLFVRYERFIEKGTVPENGMRKYINYLEDQRKRITRGLVAGKAKLPGVLHRVEAFKRGDSTVIGLTSVFVSNTKKVISDSSYWKQRCHFQDHANHIATRRRLGVINNAKIIRVLLSKVFPSRVLNHAKSDDKFLIGLILLVKNRHDWTSNGKIFRKE